MNQDKRRYPRRSVLLDVELRYPSGKIITVKTRDVSDGGIFLVMGDHALPEQGEVIHLELVGDSLQKETLPSAEAVVVHRDQDGVGVAFIEMDLDAD